MDSKDNGSESPIQIAERDVLEGSSVTAMDDESNETQMADENLGDTAVQKKTRIISKSNPASSKNSPVRVYIYKVRYYLTLDLYRKTLQCWLLVQFFPIFVLIIIEKCHFGLYCMNEIASSH